MARGKRKPSGKLGTNYPKPYVSGGFSGSGFAGHSYYGRTDSLTKADRVRNDMLEEARLLKSLEDPRAELLRETALALPIASLERLA